MANVSASNHEPQPGSGVSRLLFDHEDYDLLDIVRRIVAKAKRPELGQRLFDPALHPRGIKELGAPKALRIAHAVVDLLQSLEEGQRDERIRALRAVRDEVLHNGSASQRRNVARVLLEIMKRLVRASSDPTLQLELAHDFRDTMAGNPRHVRAQLLKYHLIEMPEPWNQLAFDHHVHDAHSKGRKSPTHLIMDAWIKGIRSLSVVYYNYVSPAAASELLEAAEIMDVQVRIGVELGAVWRDKLVYLVWAPRGFHSRKDFLAFLGDPAIAAFTEQGRAVALYRQQHVLRVLEAFNRTHLPKLNEEYGIGLEPVSERAFLAFVGVGQASLLHLAEYIHAALLPLFKRRTAELGQPDARTDRTARDRSSGQLDAMIELTTELIAERYLSAAANPELPDDSRPAAGPDVPELLRLGPAELVDRLAALPSGFRITLNPSNLTAEDALEVLYHGRGRITHIEIFNLKDWADGRVEHRAEIDRLRRVLNSGNVVEAKRLVLDILHQVEQGTAPDRAEREAAIREILRNITRLQGSYRYARLRSRLGSDSTGRARHSPGMGLVVVPTLTRRSCARIYRSRRRVVPVRTEAYLRVTYMPRRGEDPTADVLYRALRRVPLLRPLGYVRQREWAVAPNSTHIDADGNIATLGGLPEEPDNALALAAPEGGRRASSLALSWRCLDTRWKNTLKVLLGFVPAFATFYLTKSWWLLAYFGAAIWFSITGVRNVVQAVVGAGGLFRSSLLKWNDFVSWNRVADSLFYTGFSVPLLDYLVKTLLLDRGFGVTAGSSPLLLYAAMALANGTYISTHNVLRGLPPAAAAANFFRTVLSIPIAYGVSAGVAALLRSRGADAAMVASALQPWATIISKASSDVVAALIEGTADRQVNLGLREGDVHDKLGQLHEAYARIDLLFPEGNVLDLLGHPKKLVRALREVEPALVHQLIVHALDLMYFWAYQPRGETVLRRVLHDASAEEREVIRLSQRVLRRKRLVSEMLLDGLVGHRFDRALAFYLSRFEAYLGAVDRMARSAKRRRAPSATAAAERRAPLDRTPGTPPSSASAAPTERFGAD